MGAEAHWPAHGRVLRRYVAGRLVAFRTPAAYPAAPYRVDHKLLPLLPLATARMRGFPRQDCLSFRARYRRYRTRPGITARSSLLPIVGHKPQAVRSITRAATSAAERPRPPSRSR